MVQKLAEFGLTAGPEAVQRILTRSQRFGSAHHRPLTDAEFVVIAESEGATDVG